MQLLQLRLASSIRLNSPPPKSVSPQSAMLSSVDLHETVILPPPTRNESPGDFNDLWTRMYHRRIVGIYNFHVADH